MPNTPERQIPLAIHTDSHHAERGHAVTHNLQSVFGEIRGFLAGNSSGITRDETLAREIMNLLFCKLHDELHNNRKIFAVTPQESPSSLRQRIVGFFEDEVKARYSDVFEPSDSLTLDANSLAHVISALEAFHLSSTERDVIGDAFEVFIGPTLRGSDGQFFTPKNVVRLLVESLDPKPHERVVDPACGSGGFLVAALDHMTVKGVSRSEVARNIFGIDKDRLLARIAKTYLTLLGQHTAGIYCANSLDRTECWPEACRKEIRLDSFDVVLTNPPFGAKIPVQGSDLLSQFELGHQWNRRRNDEWVRTDVLLEKQPPQVLFIERCIQLVKEGGRIGIVLPEGIFGNPSDRYIWEFLFQRAEVLGVVSLPPETFQPSTHTKTSLLILRRHANPTRHYSVFMGIAESVGHDKNGKSIFKIRGNGSYILDERGRKIPDDDTPGIAAKFKAFQVSQETPNDHLGFSLPAESVHDHILIPEYYNPEITAYLHELESSGKYELTTMGELIERHILSVKRGNEIGSQFYGTGEIPFVRTTDVVNWEIKMDPVKAVSEDVYEEYRRKQDVRPGDILFVSDGTFLIGRTAMVTELDVRIIIQSHLRKLRLLKEDWFDRYYLFYLLNTKIVRRQVQAKTFVQATISTLGNRLNEIALPVHRDHQLRTVLGTVVRQIIEARSALRKTCLALMESSV